VNEAEIEDAVRAGGPQAVCERLLSMVLKRGGTDNVTVVVMRVLGGGTSGLRDGWGSAGGN
jgi:protein phosphatase